MNLTLLVALFGAGAMAMFALGLWLPAYLRHRAVLRRLSGFVLAGTAAGFAMDLGGRRRSRATRRAFSERNRWAVRQVNRMIVQSQADVSFGEVLAAMALLGILGLTLVVIWTGIWPLAIAGAAASAAAPLAWLHWKRRRIERKFAAQLLDTVALLASSVQSGHSLLQALEHVTSEAPEPTRSTIGLVVREIGLGASQEDALERLADRLPSEDLELIVSVVNIHHQIGGSLAKVLDSIAETIRERAQVAGEIKGLTAQQRYSAYVLSLLPVVAAGALMLFSPDYAGILFEPGPLRNALMIVAVMVVGGFFTMNRLARIDL